MGAMHMALEAGMKRDIAVMYGPNLLDIQARVTQIFGNDLNITCMLNLMYFKSNVFCQEKIEYIKVIHDDQKCIPLASYQF